ncbi:hypothetical protein [Pseudaestuariivita atlantica]|uniref:hypothetical protein n=1 Tax=Pseudaestuariivita atlantica TaxID=1317121 RepID=UPI0013F3BF24|nr:hypothetical protein [Pseudaestuariivita atlantica]
MAELERQLVALRARLSAWMDEVAIGEIGSGTDGKRMLTDVSGWIRTALDLERKLEERKKHDRGIAPGRDYALDFDAARVEIGCRLDRLRACGGTGDLP